MKSKIVLAIVGAIVVAGLVIYFYFDRPETRLRRIAGPPADLPAKAVPKAAKKNGAAALNGTSRRSARSASPATVDEILATMTQGNIAFNAPEAINVADTASIQLLLSLAQSIDDLSRKIAAAGRIEGATIQVANRMEARLSGAGFQITAVTPEVQAISATDTTRWAWDVKPTAVGSQRLHLTLSAILNVDGSSTPRAIRTFDKTIEVKVTWPQRTERFISKNWQWLWVAILVPVGGWIWNRKKRRRKR